jgi:hydrogenase expression/formation protein HypE
MKNVVYSSLGRKTPRMVVGPGIGADNAVISLGGKGVMILTVDPVSAIPSFGMKLSAWLSVHLIASDYATSGLRPAYASFSFNFPPKMNSGAREEYVKTVGRECEKLGVSIAAGHTGSYPGAGYTVIGAGSMFGFAGANEYVDSSMAMAGDSILMTKTAAIEATASLALSFPKYTGKKVGNAVLSRAKEMIGMCSTVDDALLAAKTGLRQGGVSSMHDATEGGVLGGLHEMALASRKAFFVEEEKISVSAEASAICAAFGLNPLTSLSEGTLLLTCAPERIGELRTRLRHGGIPVKNIGSVREGLGLWISNEGRKPKLVHPTRDTYWKAYDRAVQASLG